MRVVIVAQNSMSDYVGSLASEISRHVNTTLFVPFRFDGDYGCSDIYRFPTGKNKHSALFYFLNPYLAWKIWKSIVNIKPNVIHLVNSEGYPWSLLWAKLAAIKKIPLIVTLHDPEPHPGNLFDWLNSILRVYVLKKSTQIHIHNERFLPYVLALGIQPNKITVIPHGSIANLYLSCKKEGIEKERVVLFFGRLEEYKGLDFLVDAAIQEKSEFKFIIAGPGKLSEELSMKIVSHPEIFEFHNKWLSKSEVATLFQRAKVCVLPYRQATQSSLPLLSAAFNVPVVASNVGAFVDDVPMVNGILFQFGDTGAFIKAIEQAENSIPYYPKSHEFEALSEKFIALYKQVLI